ncbi:MAG: MarR family transcriptional regulator [Patescibacteria group bacterium]
MTPHPTPSARDIGIKIHKISCLMGRTAEHALARTVQLSFSEFRMLMALHHGRDLTQKRVAAYHGITEAAVSRQIELLKTRKLITAIENVKNRRERKLALTARGAALLPKAQKALERVFLKPFNSLATEKKTQLNNLLQTLADALEAHQP